MDFAARVDGGHFGPRKFWRLYLPRLKYHNPSVSMTVNRTTNQVGPATMTIFFSPTLNVFATSPNVERQESSINERMETIDMKHKHSDNILKQLMTLTQAVEIKPSEEEEQLLREITEQRSQSEQDRIRSRVDLEARRQEQKLLEQARQAVDVDAMA